MKKIRVGGIGARDFKKLEYVNEFVAALPDHKVVLVSGGARGVDATFAGTSENGKWKGKESRVHPLRLERGLSREEVIKRAYARNCRLVQDCDIVIAFWDQASGGTANAMGQTIVYRKPCYFIGPNKEGFSEALAAVLEMIRKIGTINLGQRSDNEHIGEVLRAMPVNTRILRLPIVEKGKEGSEFVAYNRMGDVLGCSPDPHAAIVSAFGRFVK